MRKSLRPTLLADGSALAALLLLLASPLAMTPAAAEPEVHRSHVVKVQTGGAEVIEADVSDLLPGESEMYVTENGTTVDLLRTEDGIEIWIDGELVSDSSTLEAQVAHAHRLEDFDLDFDIDVDCEGKGTDASDCLHRVMIARHGDAADLDVLAAEHDVRVIRIEKREKLEDTIVD